MGEQFKSRSRKEVCTQEAKLCPDGSSVSRTGPNCEFAPCPQTSSNPISTETENWEIYNDPKFKFQIQYPSSMVYQVNDKRDDLLLGGARFLLNYNDNEFHPQASEIHIWVFDSFGMTLEDWLVNNSTKDVFGTSPDKEFYSFKNLGNVNIAGIEGIQFKDEAFGFVHTAAAVKREDFIYVVGYVKVSDDFSTTYNKMLSTFNFSI